MVVCRQSTTATCLAQKSAAAGELRTLEHRHGSLLERPPLARMKYSTSPDMCLGLAAGVESRVSHLAQLILDQSVPLTAQHMVLDRAQHIHQGTKLEARCSTRVHHHTTAEAL